MPKGRFPFRRTVEFLTSGRVVATKSLKTVLVNYAVRDDRGKGLRDFILKDLPQLQHKNPHLQIVTMNHTSNFPHLRFFFDDKRNVIVDVDGKTDAEILDMVELVAGATKSELDERAVEKFPGRTNPANFGKSGHCFCMCEKPGQVPCSSIPQLTKKPAESATID